MTDPLDRVGAATRARVAACGLALGRSVDTWSLVLTALALACALGLALQAAPVPLSCLLFSAGAGGVQKAYALRVAFDEALFRFWAERWSVNAASGDPAVVATPISADLLALDQALVAMRLRNCHGESVRDLDSRIEGARKLFGRQLIALGAQAAAWLLAVLALQLRSPG
ncbi:MAG: hypothetical protein Q8M11_04130 [Sulfuritalea sp.]|nr:hypothetical protein [Sulfuritalea sp.]MDP1985588.1 hypothetical protein [Sulfuritalea sp.]